jgi:ABC-2 type transport system permease protein
MMSLLKSELFRLRKRPQSWLLLLIAFLLAGLFYGGFTVGALVTSGSDASELKDPLPFSELPDFGLSIALGFFGGVMLVIVAAGMMGNEYSWNTLRPLVARARSRASLLAAKLVALLIYAVIFSFVLAVLVGAMSLVSTMVVGIDSGLSASSLADAVWFTGRSILVGLPYLAFAFMIATVTRSNAAGIAGALGLSFIEQPLFGLLGAISDTLGNIQKGGIAYNVNKVLFDGLHTSGEWLALGIVLLYTAIFVALSFVVFLRRDVTSG